ncbi:MAG: PrsW family intramembrane metalloprotease [Atopobiaceae bacterium]|nr:PrsW family intramembrane metalloprotease [Atopobiaceae bacterium]
MVSGITDHVEGILGDGSHIDLDFSHFFSEVSHRHTKEEAEEIFICGTPTTTPTIQEAGYRWRRPWLYSRMLSIMLLSLAGLLLVWICFQNAVTLPGIILLGSFAVPFATLVFFYEMNVPRNISFLEMLEDFFMGGVASILVAHPLFALFPESGTGGFVPSLLTALIEEFAKLIIVACVIHRSNEGRYLLNGLLFGAAVGSGYASFESAGYAFISLLEFESDLSMLLTIVLRGFLAIGGHVAWAAITGVALSIALDRGPVTWKVFLNSKFWTVFAIPIAMHTLWDWFSFPACIPLCIGVWIVLLVLIRRGFSEVNSLART